MDIVSSKKSSSCTGQVFVLASVLDPRLKEGNLGDLFGYELMEKLCKPYDIQVKRLGTKDNIVNNTFSLVGSICHLCNNKAVSKKIIIIGCGIIRRDETIWNNKNIEWRGVRGPETLKLIGRKDLVISDPGLLISDLFPMNPTPKKKIGYIIHGIDREQFFRMFPEKKQYLIENYSTYETFTNQLSQYESVISSSLHGIIFCHSYSVPVCSIKVTDKIMGGDFKYIDYYRSVGNTTFTSRHPISKTTNFEDLVNNEWQPDKGTIENFKKLQKELIISCVKEVIERSS